MMAGLSHDDCLNDSGGSGSEVAGYAADHVDLCVAACKSGMPLH